MQLGQWVEFQHIVVKDRQGAGSSVRTKGLAKPKAGIVMGVRPVYDAQPGSPPQLSNRRMVLLVATSLHTCYRVFPADAQLLSGPPVRKRAARSASSAPAAPSSASDDDDDGERSPVTPTELELWVADALNRQIAQSTWFTAYDITVALRSSHPLDEIEHATVREIVHRQMQSVITSGLYATEQATYGPSSAIRYVPA